MTRLLTEATRLHDVTVGKFDQFKRQLAEANFDGELLEVLLKRQDLVNGMVGWVREQLVPPAVGGRIFDGSNLVGWFGDPHEQVNNMMRWNGERRWGFTGADFPDEPEEYLPRYRNDVLVLVAYLPDEKKNGLLVPGYIRTYNEYCRIISDEQPGSGFYHHLETTSDELRLFPGTEKRHEPGIRWMVVNLGAKPNTPPIEAREENSAHAEVLAVFAQMPGYVRAQEWFKPRTRLWLTGYQATTHRTHRSAWSEVPNMFCHQSLERNQFSIHEDGVDNYSRDTFAPTARKL